MATHDVVASPVCCGEVVIANDALELLLTMVVVSFLGEAGVQY
jgi:hypothetical protein